MKVFLFKSSADDSDNKADKYETLLTSMGYQIENIPVISFNFCNLDSLWERLCKPDEFSGIIFTSPRCVQAVKNCIQIFSNEKDSSWTSPHLQGKWMNKLIFCVGPATTEAINNIFQNSCKIITGDNADAASLGDKIVKVMESVKSTLGKLSILYPCGNLKRDTLQNIISQNSLESEAIIVYETVENPDLKCILKEKLVGLENDKDSVFVYFSPSGINYTLPYLTDHICNKSRKLIAIGPTTKDALVNLLDFDSKNVFQCVSPTPDGLLNVLKTL